MYETHIFIIGLIGPKSRLQNTTQTDPHTTRTDPRPNEWIVNVYQLDSGV